MKIQKISLPGWNGKNIQHSKNNQSQPISNNNTNKGVFAYEDYNISFGARLNRTPENFQEFNSNNIPKRVKEYLLEDFDTRKQIHPTELQKQAYEWLNVSSSVEDVKEAYKEEPLFADLKSVKNTKATRGLLYKLRFLELNTKEPVFKKEFDESNKDDLTVYLVKKIYLEGKTLKEINEDFKKEAKPYVNELLEGEKFTYADLSSLGVRFPKLAYWNSFQATRADKDYNPSKRNGNYYKEFEKEAASINRKGHEVSEETRKKLSESTTRWWASLTKEELAEQVQKMLEGKAISEKEPKDSVYFKFQGPIQTIAMDKVGFSQKLAQLYSDRYNDEEFLSENDNFASRSRAIMLEFWNDDPKFKEAYVNAYRETINLFEDAYDDKENPEKIEKLLTKAVDIKNNILENAQKRRAAKIQEQKEREKQAKELQKHNFYRPAVPVPQKHEVFDINSLKDVKKRFRTIEKEDLKIYPDIFQQELLAFLLDEKNIDFKTMQNIVLLRNPDIEKMMNLTQKEKDVIYGNTKEKIISINEKFNFSHILTTRTSDLIMNNTLYEITQKPVVMAYERDYAFEYINNHDLREEFLKRKDSINKEMKDLAKPMSDKNARQFTLETFIPLMKKALTNGFEYFEPMDERSKVLLLAHIKSVFAQNANEVKKTVKFLSGFSAHVKFINDKTKNEMARKITQERMILDYLNWFTMRHPQVFKQ